MVSPPSRDPDDPLDTLLERSRQDPPPRPSVAPEVWRRIAAAQRAPRFAGWLERVHAAFAQPAFAALFVTACVLLGLFLAEVRTARAQAEQGARFVQGYLRVIDPLWREGNATPRADRRP